MILTMKRINAWLLAALLLLTLSAGTGIQAEGKEYKTELVVGNATAMRGDFFTGLWGNGTSDNDVRDLLHGYNLAIWAADEGMFILDPTVVSESSVTQNGAGDRTYRLTLCDDLFYSDGSRITAWDYAFSFLFQISPEVAQLGGVPAHKEQFLGYAEYLNGTAGYLAGVRVPADDTLEITVRHEYLPFFYEYGLLCCNPYPIDVIAPGVVVRDDGEGVYLANADETVTEPVFTSDLLQRTVMDEQTGYKQHPSKVSGPYVLTGWDGVTARFEINPYFKGDWHGNVPSIRTLVYTLADNETMVKKLKNGEFDLLNKVTKADTIAAGMALLKQGDFRMSAYPREGLSYISFCCEKDTVSSRAVRQAIAWCLDRDALVKDYTGRFGVRVDGYIGIGQWMYGLVTGTMKPPVTPPEDENDAAAVAAYQQALAPYEALSLDGLTQFTVNLVKANRLLEDDGWKMNRDGTREKRINGRMVQLELTMYYPEGNKIVESFRQYLTPNLRRVGIRLKMVPMDMPSLLTEFYKQDGERDADMIYLASNFDLIFDPSVNFIADSNGEPNWSYTNCSDQTLYRLALAMRTTEPGDLLTYCQNWIAFQKRFNMILPMLPIYSNTYFDFYFQDLQDYWIMQETSWGKAIVGSYIGETPATIADQKD